MLPKVQHARLHLGFLSKIHPSMPSLGVSVVPHKEISGTERSMATAVKIVVVVGGGGGAI